MQNRSKMRIFRRVTCSNLERDYLKVKALGFMLEIILGLSVALSKHAMCRMLLPQSVKCKADYERISLEMLESLRHRTTQCESQLKPMP